MQTRFYVSHNGEEVGPLTTSEIEEKLNQRVLWAVDYVYLEDKSDWVTLSEFLAQQTPHAPAPSTSTKAEPPPIPAFDDNTPTAPALADAPTSILETLPEVGNKSPSQTAVTLVGGVGSIDLTYLKAETLTLSLVDKNKNSLKVAASSEIKIKPAPAVRLEMKSDSKAVVGQPLTVHVQAFDSYGNLDRSCMAQVSVKLTGSAKSESSFSLQNGEGNLTINNTKAEKVELVCSAPSLNETQPLTLTFTAGPAVQYLIESPPEVIAGQSAKVVVRAVDAYGNLATDASGTVQLTVDGHASVKRVG